MADKTVEELLAALKAKEAAMSPEELAAYRAKIAANQLIQSRANPYKGGGRQAQVMMPKAGPFTPKFEDGEEVLTFYRGKWTHVKWSADYFAWHLGYAGAFLRPATDRAFAPLPPKPENADGFYDWKE